MTDRQLAMYLYTLSNTVEMVALAVDRSIVDGERAEVLKWAGEGDPPRLGIGAGVEGYKFVPEGEFIAFQMVMQLATRLRQQADALMVGGTVED